MYAILRIGQQGCFSKVNGMDFNAKPKVFFKNLHQYQIGTNIY